MARASGRTAVTIAVGIGIGALRCNGHGGEILDHSGEIGPGKYGFWGSQKKMDIGQLPQGGNFPGASNVLGKFSVLMVCTMHTIHNFFAQKNAKAKNSP